MENRDFIYPIKVFSFENNSSFVGLSYKGKFYLWTSDQASSVIDLLKLIDSHYTNNYGH